MESMSLFGLLSRFLWIGILFSLSGCGYLRRDRDPIPPPRINTIALEELYSEMLSEALSLRDPETGWLTPDDCDGMIWTGKYAASRGVEGVDVGAAEFPASPGRFGRRPPPRCWNPEQGDVGSKTTWSRDMAIAGLLPYSFATMRLDILTRHADYGEAHDWRMGEPVFDGRVFYTPSVVGVLYEVIYDLGGGDNPKRRWPSLYSEGLTDYEAHLQVMDIWLRSKIEGLGHGPISEVMYNRLEEHAAREPENPFYQYVWGIYSGDLQKAVDLLLREDGPVGSYVRCKEFRRCQLAERIFTASNVLDYLKE